MLGLSLNRKPDFNMQWYILFLTWIGMCSWWTIKNGYFLSFYDILYNSGNNLPSLKSIKSDILIYS